MYKRDLFKNEIGLIPEALKEVFDTFVAAGFEIYLVGAGVRRILLGDEPVDCDLTTNAKPEQTLKLMKSHKPFYENDFGMVGVPVLETEVYEITTYRSEKGYSDFRRPDKVVWGKSLEEDIKRRDFSMNSVVIGPKKSKSSTYELIDYLGGLEDFETGIIRAVGDPQERFGEDALRMMRAIRFANTLSFKIEAKTLAAIKEKAVLLKKISAERIRDELWKILGSQSPAEGMRMLIETGLMQYIIPEVLTEAEVEQKGRHKLDVLDHMLESLASCPSSNPLIRLATFLHDLGKAATRKLRCGECGWVMRDKDRKDENHFVCPRCNKVQTEREITTFYGHQVVGAKMVREIGERLRLTKKQTEKLFLLVRWHMFSYQKEMTDAAIRRLIRRVGKENIGDLILLRIGDRKGGGSKTTSWRLMELQKRIGEQLYEPMEIRDLVIDGSDVMRMLDINPGPKVGKILKELFEEVIEDVSKNKREYLLERIKQLGEKEA